MIDVSLSKRRCSWPVGFAAVVALLALVMLARPAAADEQLPSPENAEAKKHIEAGNKAFQAAQSKTDPEVQRRHFEEAILHYKAGAKVETKHAFTFYWNLGHAYRQVGNYTQADWFYRAFLQGAPSSLVLHREAAQRFIDQMHDEQNRKATLMGPSEPAPEPMRGPLPPAALDAHGQTSPWYGDRVGWCVAGAGTIGVVVGGGLLWTGDGLYEDAAQETRAARIQELEDRGRQRVVAGAIVGGAGFAALVVGVIKLMHTEHAPSRPASIQVTVGGSGFAIRGSF